MIWSKVLGNLQYMSPDDPVAGGTGVDPAKVVAVTTTTEAKPIDWSTIDPTSIPEDLLKKNPAYEKILKESIDRRQTIKSLKSDLAKLNLEPESDEAVKTVATDTTTTTTNPNADIAKLTELVTGLTEKFNSQFTENLSEWRKSAAEVTGIKSDTVINGINGANRAEVLANAQKIATELGIVAPVKQVGRVGNTTGQRDRSAFEQAKLKMTGATQSNITNMELHKQMGGGIYEDTEGFE